jgi:hypothetical protein
MTCLQLCCAAALLLLNRQRRCSARIHKPARTPLELQASDSVNGRFVLQTIGAATLRLTVSLLTSV